MKSFTPNALKAQAFAREEAIRLKSGFTGTEHLLLTTRI